MSATDSEAVFLSYASQDAEAATKISDALRAAGVEVWFDQSELVGGDAWDAKIRRRIAECALFMPVISAATQSRPEGYFRLEWKLAVDHSHLMSDDYVFLVPVIIDDTSEAEARVPDRFRDFQWTRLALAEAPTTFAQQMRDLLVRRVEAAPGGGRRPERGERKQDGRSVRWTRVIPICALIVGLLYATIWFWQAPKPPATKSVAVMPSAPAADKTASPVKVEAPALSDARKLLMQAKPLYEPWDGATRLDFATAEKLLAMAGEKDPTDGEVWAATALVHCGQYALGYDRSPSRLERGRLAAENAVRLAPDSVQAKLAQAFAYRFSAATRTGVENTLRELVEKAPTDHLVIRTFAVVLAGQGKFDDAIKVLDRAIALPGGDPVAEYNQFYVLSASQRFGEAEALLDRAIAAHPQPYFYRAKAQVLMSGHGDLDAAAALLPKLPRAYLLEDDGAVLAHNIYLWRREPEKALEIWSGIARDLIECAQFSGPRTFLVGQANMLAKRPAAAEADWQAALRVVEQLHEVQPNAALWVFWKARLLAALGRKQEAEEELQTFEQLVGVKGLVERTIPIYLLLGRKDEVLTALEKGRATVVARGNATQIQGQLNYLRLSPDWDLLRDEPRFQKLIEK